MGPNSAKNTILTKTSPNGLKTSRSVEIFDLTNKCLPLLNNRNFERNRKDELDPSRPERHFIEGGTSREILCPRPQRVKR